MDTKNKKTLLIGGGIMTGVIVAAVGIGIVVLSGDEEANSKPGYATNTPTLQQAAQEPGMVAIEPTQITLSRTPAGTIEGIATVSALFQEFRATDITLTDPRYSWKSECLAVNTVLASGAQCNIVISYKEPTGIAEAGEPGAQPSLIVNGQSKTPGGSIIPVEAKAVIATFNPSAAPSAGLGIDGNPLLTSGAPAPMSLDPYGPAPAGGSYAANMPPVDYSQVPMQAPQPMLTPQEQFLLARRQAVFGGMRPSSSAPNPVKRQGGWDELNIPTTTSSNPQDMTRVVTMDRIITAALARTYDSRSGQQVVAQVDRNVYGAHGRTILIPRGSTLVGTAAGGGERVAISWTQLIRPDGARFRIEASSGDAMGQAGVPGRVNERIMKRYGAILLGTALNVATAKASNAMETSGGGDYSQPARNNGAIISDIVRQDIEKITSDIVQRNSRIETIITIPAGTRITVIPTMDLQLRPMTGPEIQASNYPRVQNAGAPAPRFDVDVNRGQGQPGDGGQAMQFNNTPPQQFANPGQQQIGLPPTKAPATGATPPWNSN